WNEVCDRARMTEVERHYFWRRQFLNPYAFEGYRQSAPQSFASKQDNDRPPVGCLIRTGIGWPRPLRLGGRLGVLCAFGPALAPACDLTPCLGRLALRPAT